ncbi:hypothetical protein ACHAP5_011128 [Fusarium lateritium]
MVYSPNANTLLRARQFQRLHAHSLSNPVLFIDLLTPDVLHLASQLEPDPSIKHSDNEADWDPNWTTTRGSLVTTVRRFVKAAEESLKDPASTRRRTLFEPAPPSTVAEEETSAAHESPQAEPVVIPGGNQTASTIRDLEREARSQAAQLADRDERIADLQSQLQDMQSPKLSVLQQQLDEAEKSISEMSIAFDKTTEELRLEKTQRAEEKVLLESVRGGPAILDERNRRVMENLVQRVRARARAVDYEAPVKSLPYYHSLHIPLIIGNTGETHTLKICIHPNWRIKGTSSTIHLRHLEATLDNETEHDGKVLALGYDVADLWGTWVGYQEGRHEYKTIRQIQSQRFNLWSLIFIILAVVSGLLTTGHPVWMVTSCYTSSLSIPLAQPISFIYREWTETLLPILSPIQLHDQNSRARPAHLFSRLDQELFQIQLGLATWNASKLPGPGPELFTLLEKSQNCIPDSSAFNALWRSAANALKGGIAEIIADRIQESDSTLESIQHISLYWNITGGENSQVIRSLRVLYDGMVNLDAIETFLIQSKKDFERQSSHPEYTGLSTSLSIQDMLDAITHTLTHINPYTSLIPPLLSRALEKLTLVNETITAQNQIWNTLLLGRGVVERHVLEFDNRWLLRRTTGGYGSGDGGFRLAWETECV